MRKVLTLLALVVAVALLLGACAPAATSPQPAATSPAGTSKPATAAPTTAAIAPTAAPAATKPAAAIPVKLSGIAGSFSDSGLYIALGKGYFAQEGLNVDYIQFKAVADALASLAKGDLDVGGGGWTPGIANAIQRGVDMKVVGDKMSKEKGFTNYRLSIRKDLYDSGQIKGVADLKGKKVGVTAAATMGVMMYPALKVAGLTLKDADMVELSFPDMLAALTNKSLDAAVLAEPLLTKAVDEGLVVRSQDFFDFDPAPSCGLILYSPNFVKNVDAGNRFMKAYVRALRDYNDAFLKGKDKQQIIDILAKATNTTDKSMFTKMDMPGFNPNGYADSKAMDWAMKYWLSSGEMKEPIAIDKIVDNSYADNAVKVLGKYAN